MASQDKGLCRAAVPSPVAGACPPGLLTSAASQWLTGSHFSLGHKGKDNQRQKQLGGLGSALLTSEHPLGTVLKNKPHTQWELKSRLVP